MASWDDHGPLQGSPQNRGAVGLGLVLVIVGIVAVIVTSSAEAHTYPSTPDALCSTWTGGTYSDEVGVGYANCLRLDAIAEHQHDLELGVENVGQNVASLQASLEGESEATRDVLNAILLELQEDEGGELAGVVSLSGGDAQRLDLVWIGIFLGLGLTIAGWIGHRMRREQTAWGNG